MNNKIDKLLSEMFGEPIGAHAGQPMVGVRDERISGCCEQCGLASGDCDCGMSTPSKMICPECGQMPIDGSCGCSNSEVCPSCGKMPLEIGASCGCGYISEAKKKHYPNLTKKQAKKRYAAVEKKKEAGKSLEDIFSWASDPGAAFGALKAAAKK